MLRTRPRLCSTVPHSKAAVINKDYKFIKVATREQFPKAVQVSLNRADVHNAFNEVLISELTEAFNHLSQVAQHQQQLRSIVLTGEGGGAFSAGADLNWMKSMVNYTKEQNQHDAQKLFDMFYAIKSCSVPVIARVNGSALGGGVGLVAACDIAFACASYTTKPHNTYGP
jgi:methylglutaconyl-CoA hydratase